MITPEERKYLVGAMSELLEQYNYKHTDNALNQIIDEWAGQKANLIEAFKRHPNYVKGKFMIAMTSNYERATDENQIKKFSGWLANNCITNTSITPKNILNRRNGCTFLPNDLFEFLISLNKYADRCLSKETVEVIEHAIPEVRVHEGEKTSRAINRICTYLNYNTVRGYNREFAKYADALSPMTVERKVILSINPLDYLTMSFGNSWSSCHTIDKKNVRNMPNGYRGEYSSGTMSYMLDKTSMVLYTVGDSYKGDDYCSQPKINRQMFHYGEEKLIQGRLYPQDNDGFSNQYAQYRNIVQNIIATIFDFPNLWTFKTGIDAAGEYVVSYGTHYRDYNNFSNCSVSRIKGSANENYIAVGAEPICVRCGKRHNDHKNIDCCVIRRCAHCGRIHNEDELTEINGRFYCSLHCYRCVKCGEWHTGVPNRTEDGKVCDACRDKYYIRCSGCFRYVRKEKIHNKDMYSFCPTCKELDDRPRYTYNDTWFDDFARNFTIRYNDGRLWFTDEE